MRVKENGWVIGPLRIVGASRHSRLPGIRQQTQGIVKREIVDRLRWQQAGIDSLGDESSGSPGRWRRILDLCPLPLGVA